MIIFYHMLLYFITCSELLCNTNSCLTDLLGTVQYEYTLIEQSINELNSNTINLISTISNQLSIIIDIKLSVASVWVVRPHVGAVVIIINFYESYWS